jgi:AcrR family transcriptional regulator
MTPSDSLANIRSGGRRIALYAELGGYFLPDGQLNGPAFRAFLKTSLADKAKESGSAASPQENAGLWLSSYLEQVLTYLEEKEMEEAALAMVELAVDEATKLGVAKLALDPQRMQRMFSLAAKGKDAGFQRKQGADEKRQRIFDCALKVFTERGFHQATMDEIAEAAEVAKGTLYRYFKSKEDLLDQLLLVTSQKVVERFSVAFRGQSDVLEEIQRFIEAWVTFIEENHALYRLIQAEGIIAHSGRPTLFYEYLISNFPMVKERIVSMNTGGELKTMSFHSVAYGMLGFIDGVVHKWFRSGMTYPLRDEVPVILEVLFNGFANPSGRRKIFFVPPEDAVPASSQNPPSPDARA